nr:MAG TPA: hypothetical protein [Caudoviricetes sp.]
MFISLTSFFPPLTQFLYCSYRPPPGPSKYGGRILLG